MVRLKAVWILQNPETKKISIPYGAIKRIISPLVFFIEDLFQFLMVRLKEGKKTKCIVYENNFNSLWCD